VNWLSYLLFLCAVGSLTSAVIVWRLRSARINRVAAAAALVYSVWAAGMAVAYGAFDLNLALAGFKFSFFGSLLIAPLLSWIYLELSETPPRLKIGFLVAALSIACLTLIDLWTEGFYYGAFEPGPWGNRGIADLAHPHWVANVMPFLALLEIGFGVFQLVRARPKASVKLRRQITSILYGALASAVLLLLPWLAEATLGIPNLALMTSPSVQLGVTLYLLARYRYLGTNIPLLERHLVDVVQNVAFLVDRYRRIAGANPAAQAWLGQSEVGLLGADVISLFDDPVPIEREWERAVCHQTLHRGVPVRVAGTVALVTLSPHFDRYGDFAGAVLLAGPVRHLKDTMTAWGLTVREQDILVLVWEGASHQDIADRLGISPTTVKSHSHNLLVKAGVTSRSELLVLLLNN
jgi:DNA-binding CsgD family transcriptional regulator